MTNLLRNGSFEGINEPGEWTRLTHSGHEYGEIYTPVEWVTWWDEDPQYRRPECHVIPRKDPYLVPPRIHDGDWAVKGHTKNGRQHWGTYQVVGGLEIGATYELSAWVHAWSAHPGIGPGDPVNDGHCSSGVGCGPFAVPYAGTPDHNGDPVNDAISNFAFWVGITYGGMPDPLSVSASNRSAEWAIYNAYHRLAFEFVATSTTIVVYLVSRSIWEFENSDAYWDDAQLVKKSGNGGAGYPYKSVVDLLPQDATYAEKCGVLDITHEKKRTFTQSPNDAFVTHEDRVEREIHAWGIERIIPGSPNPKAELYEWVRRYYPPVPKIIFHSLNGEPPPDPITLWQRHPDWRDTPRIGTHCTTTIGDDGCWETNCASAQRWYGIDADATPETVNIALGPEAFTQFCEIAHSPMKDALGLRVVATTTNIDQVNEWLKHDTCFADVVEGTSKHFVFVSERDLATGALVAHDPWTGRKGFLHEMYPSVDSWRLIEKYTAPLPPPSDNKIGPHLQQMMSWKSYVTNAKPGVVKRVLGFEDCWTIWAANPDVEIVLRHFTNYYDKVLNAPTAQAAAVEWWSYHGEAIEAIARQLPSRHPDPNKVIWVENMNELVATFDPLLDWIVEIEVAIWELIRSKNLPIGMVCACGAVGNPHESEFVKFLPLARIASMYPNLCKHGYHAYHYGNAQESGLVGHWKWLAGRWEEMDKVFRAHGYPHVTWFCGEAGVVGGKYISGANAFLGEMANHDAMVAAAHDYAATSYEAAAIAELEERVRFIPRYDPGYRFNTKIVAGSGMGAPTVPIAYHASAGALQGGYVLLPLDGWKSKECYSGDFGRYEEDLLELNRRGGDKAQFMIFTTGDWGKWWSFEMRDPEWDRMEYLLTQ